MSDTSNGKSPDEAATAGASGRHGFKQRMSGVGKALSHTAGRAGRAGQSARHAAGAAGHMVGQKAGRAAKTVAGAASSAASGVASAASGVAPHVRPALEKVAGGAGAGIQLLKTNPALRKLWPRTRVRALLEGIGKVDVQSAQATVRELQAQFPQETPAQIARRLTTKKALYAGGVGLATNAVPGASLALAPLDWATNATLQAELVYQIAAAYGLDVNDPARQGEMAAVFGLAFGGAKALGILGQRLPAVAKLTGKAAGKVPVAGAALGAGANALLIYALGHAAQRFYEGKLHSQPGEAQVSAAQAQSEAYIEHATRQEAVFNRVLAHVLRAGHPQAAWEDIAGGLRLVGLSDAACAAIAREWQHPQPIEPLVRQLDCDFAASLLAQCRRMAQLDGIVTDEEQRVLDLIATQCGQGVSIGV